jgi:isoamyl acetate esterase
MIKSAWYCIFLFLCSFGPMQKKRVVFFGDSITEAGVHPKGYISLLQQTLKEKGTEQSYELIGAGVSGNKVYDLYLRLEEDVFKHHPQTVVIWVGVNDVWHKRLTRTGTDPEKFEQFYTALIQKIKEKGATVYLCTPAAIGEKTDYTNELDGDLNKYADIIRTIARNTGSTLIDLRRLFLSYNLKHNKENKAAGILTTDGVHLNDAGNKAVAAEMYRHLFTP